jgi:uncharacterized protein (TIGR02996 family)
MSDEDALLAAIDAQPDEDTPRLMYADWLDEYADALPDPAAARIRAEFIRVQCQIRRLDDPFLADEREPVVEGTSADLWRRQEELLERHGRELLGPFAGLSYFDAFLERGFLAELDLSARMFLKYAALIEPLVPRPQVRLHSIAGDFDLLDSPPNRHLLRCITACRVQSTLYGELPDNWLTRVIALCPHLTRVTSFDFSYCHLDDSGLARLVAPPVPSNLVELNLSGNDVTITGIRALVRSPLWARLRRLSLQSCWQLEDAAAQVLADAPPDRFESISVNVRHPAGAGLQAVWERFGERLESCSELALEAD